MRILKFLFIFVILLFPLGEIARFQLENNLNFTINDIGISLLFITWLIYRLRKREKLNYFLLKPISFFIIICFLSLLINSQNYKQVDLLISFLYLLRWVFYSAVYFSISEFNSSFKNKIVRLMIVIGAFLIVGGYLQYFLYPNLGNLYYLGWDEHMYRMFSSFLDPNFAGAFFVLYLLFISSIFLEKLGKKFEKIIPFFLLIAMTLVAVLMTYSRSALLMFIVGSITFLLLKNKKTLIYVVFVILIFAFIVFSKNFYIENMNLLRTASIWARINSLNNTVKIIKDHYLIGVGFNAYRYIQIKYNFVKEVKVKISHANAGADNSFLFILATTGIIGLSSYIYLWIKILKSSLEDYKNKKNIFLSIIIISSCVGLFVNALFINSLFYPFIMEWMWILIGLKENN